MLSLYNYAYMLTYAWLCFGVLRYAEQCVSYNWMCLAVLGYA